MKWAWVIFWVVVVGVAAWFAIELLTAISNIHAALQRMH